MNRLKYNFESVVQVGFVVIISGLILLSVVSNYVISNVLDNHRTQAGIDLKKNATYISRYLTSNSITDFNDSLILKFKKTYDLSFLMVIPSVPDNNDEASRREWLSKIAIDVPRDKISLLAEQVINSEFNSLNRSDNQKYYFWYPFQNKFGKYMILLGKKIPILSYMDKSVKFIIFLSVISFLIIIYLYIYLTRYIISPFNRLKMEAFQAGREVENSEDDVEAVIDDYKKMISELKEKENQLLILNEKISNRADKLENFSNYLLSSMLSGIITYDNDGKILTINNSAEKILKINSEKFLNKNCSNLFDPDSKIGGNIQECRISNSNLKYTEMSHLRDNEKIILGITISKISDIADNYIGAGLFFTDVTELANLKKELEFKKQMATLGEMSGGLAHQLRNSIGAINGYANLIRKKMTLNNLPIDQISALFQESKEAEDLIQKFLNFVRPYNIMLEPTDLKPYLNDIINSFKSRSEFKLIDFTFNCYEEFSVEIDRLLLKQAIVNLIENANNAYYEMAGVIDISVIKDNEKVELTISDNAGGIETENLDKIFTPFYSSSPSGTGLGLPLASKIITLHNGNISVESISGQGTIFKVILPLSSKLIPIKKIKENNLIT